jgi:hypothetical protein
MSLAAAHLETLTPGLNMAKKDLTSITPSDLATGEGMGYNVRDYRIVEPAEYTDGELTKRAKIEVRSADFWEISVIAIAHHKEV